MYYNNNTKRTATLQQIKAEKPNISFPKVPTEDFINSLGYTSVVIEDESVPSEFQIRSTASVVLVNEVPTLRYTLIDLDAEEIKKVIANKIQEVLDSEAVTAGYDSIISACSYASSTGVFSAEGKSFLDWRDAMWTAAFQIEQDVSSDVRNAPTLAELLTELPKRV